jgi:small subunit ribosomal protein S15e
LTNSPPNKSSNFSEPDKEEDSPEKSNTDITDSTKKSKKQCQPGEKPSTVKTHLRNCIVMPEMVGNIVGVYNGKVFNPVEVKFDMIGRYLGEFSLSYKPTRHGKAGVGATKGSAHSSLK